LHGTHGPTGPAGRPACVVRPATHRATTRRGVWRSSRLRRHRRGAAPAAGGRCTRSPWEYDANMAGSTSAQAGSGQGAARPEPGRAASTRGQRTALAERLRRHVFALEGVRHPVAAPERHRAARDYVARELTALGLDVQLAPFSFRRRTYHNVVGVLSGSDPHRPRLDVPRTGDFLAAVGDARSRELLDRFVAAARPAVPELPLVPYSTRLRGWLLPLTRLSDNASFWDAGYASLMLTDTAFLRNPHYH